MNAFNRTRDNRLLDTFFIVTLGELDVCFFRFLIKFKDIGTKLDTTLTPDTLLCLYKNLFSHYKSFFSKMSRLK